MIPFNLISFKISSQIKSVTHFSESFFLKQEKIDLGEHYSSAISRCRKKMHHLPERADLFPVITISLFPFLIRI